MTDGGPGFAHTDLAAHAAFVERLYAQMEWARGRSDWTAWMEFATETGDPRLWPEIRQRYREHPETRWTALQHLAYYWIERPDLAVPLLREALQDPALRDRALETASHYPAMADDIVRLLTREGGFRWWELGELLGTLAAQLGFITSPGDFDQDGWRRDDALIRQIAAALQRRYRIDLDRLIPVVTVRHKESGELLLHADADSLAALWLNDAELQGAGLAGVELGGAMLWGADLREADLQGAALQSSILTHARLAAACLRGADLSRADLAFADLSGADLCECRLEGADLRGVNLSGTDLRGADLRGACLKEAILVQTDLGGADLRGANLREAIAAGADLDGVRFDDADLRDLLYDAATRWPGGCDPKDWGAVQG